MIPQEKDKMIYIENAIRSVQKDGFGEVLILISQHQISLVKITNNAKWNVLPTSSIQALTRDE